MSLGVRTIKVENEGEEVEVTYWVNHADEREISIDQDGADTFYSVEIAVEIANAIKELDTWSKTDAGKKQIEKMQKRDASSNARRG